MNFSLGLVWSSMQRIKQVSAHLAGGSPGLSALERKDSDDVVITLAIRSPLCKAKKGGFRDARYRDFTHF